MDLRNLFASVLNMSITGSIVIGCVILARLILKQAPKVFTWALWLVVIFRLLCPVSIPGPVSVLEFVDAPRSQTGAVEFIEPPVQSVRPRTEGETATAAPGPARPAIDWGKLAGGVWILGVVGLMAYGTVSYVNLKRRLRESVPLGRGIRESDRIDGPFVLGRTIYLPSDIGCEERRYILLHERLHLCHGDPVVKGLFWLAVCIHWFNPLVWLGFRLCGRDMELRCDEAVLKTLGGAVRSDYAQSLLNFAAGHSRLAAPLAFGEGDTGKRVRFVLSWKKTKLWLVLAGAVLCAAVLAVTLCDPAAPDTPFGHSYRVSGVVSRQEETAEIPEQFTLTSDNGLFVRRDGQTVMYGSLQKVSIPADLPEGMQSAMNPVVKAWKTEDGQWWLFEREDGELRLWHEGGYLLQLARTDLLGVSIRQSGMESYVEPVWYGTGSWDWLPEEMSVTLVNGDAGIILMPEQDVAQLQVTEEYYERQESGESVIITTEYTLRRDAKGEFSLNVSRRGKDADDFAVYRVTVGEDRYIFRLAFPAVPNETTVSVHIPEELREVEYAENGAFIRLSIPESWAYAVTSINAEELDAGITGGITFWPRGREEGKIFFGYYPDRFAVCGTGLETTELLLAGQKATVGTYDGGTLWDHISFGEYFAVWGQGHESWWAEFGDAAMEILDSAEFGVD